MTSEYKVAVKQSKRKTASIYIERDGSLSVLVPENTTEQEIKEILKANEYKIHKYQAKRELLNEKAVRREPVNGQSFLYLGRNYYLQYNGSAKEIEFKGRYFYAPEGSTDRLNDLFKEFYRKRGYKFISPRVNKYAEIMGLKIDQISILELKTRWASCSGKKPKVNFHWKVMMAPASVIDYLIVHELCHFKHKRHNADFWNEVDKYYPDYQKQVSWLKENGASLEI
ncbi:MAG: M48 family metallopeptidase [Proteobacteria bacterium]|nr:M48 family metallopeptidase [Pseudomonadota bacterium]MBU4011686.1 M48 family metallopeptidase [Pseudomonadota bacterium]